MRRILPHLMVLALLMGTNMASAEIVAKSIDYKQGQAVLEGFLAYDSGVQGKRPAVIVIHDWNGLDSCEQMRSEMLAKLGYIGFAADIYGKGVRPTTLDECRAEAGKFYANPDLLLARVRAALEEVRKNPLVDTSRIAVIGYCFGGKAALDLARSGADVQGIVSFHGGLDTAHPAAPGAIKAPLLILHGGADANVTPDKVAAFQQEMLHAGAYYKFVVYPGAVHGFTVPGKAYNEKADKISWEEMKRFLQDVFHKPEA